MPLEAPYALDDLALPTIEERMLRPQPNHYEEVIHFATCGFDAVAISESMPNFGQQMKQAADHGINMYLMTYKSAIPLADAVRGYYAELGVPVPPMLTVHPHDTSEVQRLRPLLLGIGHVAIIDQYVHSGTSIHKAAHIASQAGARHVTAIGGRWYHEAHLLDVDNTNLTSRYADFFYNLGRKALTGK